MIIDAHAHIGVPLETIKGARQVLDIADRFGVQWMGLSMGPLMLRNPTRKQVRESNDHVLRLMKHWPDRFAGYCYLNPKHGRSSRDELHRCYDAGMRGIKLWIACGCDDPLVFPVVEWAIELQVPILQHTWHLAGGNPVWHSRPDQLVTLAQRYRQATFIMAHVGGNWAYGARAVRHCENILVDTSGGNPELGQMERALEYLGPHRILFGTDAHGRSFASQLARIDSAKLSAGSAS